MEQESAQSVLRRLLRTAGEAAASSVVTPTRALRLAMARAAEKSVGLNLTVLSVTEELLPLDEVLKVLAPEWMLLALGRGGVPEGLAAFDLQLRTATVEMQTVGKLRQTPATERRITEADAALCAPLVTDFLSDLTRTAVDTALEGWADGIEAGVRIEDSRAAGMILDDRQMRIVRLSLEFAAGERQGELVVVLPFGPKPPAQSIKDSPPAFAIALRQAVMEAPAVMHAVLHRLRLSLRDVEGFEVGQVLSLPGVTVSSVTLEGPDGHFLGQARLGQVTGLRAVRLEARARREMSESAMAHHLGDAMAAAGAASMDGDIGNGGMGVAAMLPMATGESEAQMDMEMAPMEAEPDFAAVEMSEEGPMALGEGGDGTAVADLGFEAGDGEAADPMDMDFAAAPMSALSEGEVAEGAEEES